MQIAQANLEQLKEKMRSTWMAGDFGKVARYTAQGAAEFVERLKIRPTAKVLDVACGTGNLAIPAARAGATVTGVDIAPNLLEQAQERAVREGLTAAFEEGDAEQLPYRDSEFDVVMTMFGAMFAPRPERVAAELIRVCKPGGKIAMANWTREGFIGNMFALGSRFVPPPEGVPPPVLWGAEDTAKQRLLNGTSDVQTTRRILVMDFPFPPAEVVQFFREYFGPTRVAFSRLEPQEQTRYATELEMLWREHNEDTGTRTLVRAEYLEVIATRA